MVSKLQVKDLSQNLHNTISEKGFNISLFHLTNDPENANRIRVSTHDLEVELLPSKGLSLGQAWIKGKSVFWEAPIELPDTEIVDLYSDEICINGNPAPGFTFLKTLVGGVEMYGLKNWGMPVEKDGKLQPLHGETSNIPVSEVICSIEEDSCTIEANFDYRTFEGDPNLPWYQRGEPLFRVTKKIMLKNGAFEIKLEDTIENISNRSLMPDWGYHITFRPEEGARYIVPSKMAEERSGNPLPADIQTWHKAVNENVRTETGIIHKQVAIAESGLVKTQLVYPGDSILEVSTTPSPYFQTWFCNGGKGSSEFTNGKEESLLHKNWDGMGIEIGSSALDHNGNIDESVDYKSLLKPDELQIIQIKLQWIDEFASTLFNKYA
jgi:hypothetical protein